MTLDVTGGSILRARPVGNFSLPGAQMKFSANEVPEFELACDPDLGGCGWAIRGYREAHSFVEWPEDQTPESAAALAQYRDSLENPDDD